MIKLLLPLLFTLTTITEANILDVDSKRLIRIVGVIDGQILQQADKLLKLTEDKTKSDIFILLNSPGGQVFPGEVFIDAIGQAQAMGITVKCFSPVYAASMAFNIMLHCNENYVLNHTKLLFHPVRRGYKGVIKAKDALEIAKDLLKIDQRLLTILDNKLTLSGEQIRYHYDRETFWNGSELAPLFKNDFFKVVKGITGIKDIFQISPKGSQGYMTNLPDVR